MKTEQSQNQSLISYSPIEWSDSIDQLVLEKLNPDGGTSGLKNAVEKSTLLLFQVSYNDRLIGLFFARVEILLNGKTELVIVHAIAADNTPITFGNVAEQIFEKIALDSGITSIRVHAQVTAIKDYLEKNNYKLSEWVYRKNLNA